MEVCAGGDGAQPPAVMKEPTLRSRRCGGPLLKKREKWGTLVLVLAMASRETRAILTSGEGGHPPVPRQRGFTLLELIVTTAILSILLGAAFPLVKITIYREREHELRQDLWMMRDAIDRYKDVADRGAFQIKVGSESVRRISMNGFCRRWTTHSRLRVPPRAGAAYTSHPRIPPRGYGCSIFPSMHITPPSS
jgi:prepilin-type N-terminal cleavage/methylation domain-containing protein